MTSYWLYVRFSGTWIFNLLPTVHPEPMVEIPVEPELVSSEAEPEPEPEPEPEEIPEVGKKNCCEFFQTTTRL